MFLWRHKFVVALVLLAIWYWSANPEERFGWARRGLVIYNKIPVALFDLYIDLNGNRQAVDNLSEPQSFGVWWRQSRSLLTVNGPDSRTLVVGSGFGLSPSFTLSQLYVDSLAWGGIKVEQMPSSQAVKRYNTLRDRKVQVAILLRIKG